MSPISTPPIRLGRMEYDEQQSAVTYHSDKPTGPTAFLLPTSPDHLPSGLLPEHFDIRFDELLYDVPCFGVIGDQFPDPR